MARVGATRKRKHPDKVRSKKKSKRRRHEKKKSRAERQLPHSTLIGGPLKAPVNYPESGTSNEVLAKSNIAQEPVRAWVQNKFFSPVQVPNDFINIVKEQIFLPTTLEKDMETLYFDCAPSLFHYTDISQTELELTLRVVHADGTPLTGPEDLTMEKIERILAGDQQAGGRAAAASGAAPTNAGERHDSASSHELMVSALDDEHLLDVDEGHAAQQAEADYDEEDVLGLDDTLQAARRRRRRAIPSSTSERVAKRAAIVDDAGAEDMGDTGKVWLISDIFDTLWHRCEMRINQRALQKDLGDHSNIKNYLTTRLTPMTPTQIQFLHKTRLYYDQTVGVSTQAKRIEDVHRSRHIHMRGMLTGLSNGVKHFLPPQQSMDFKFTKASPRFYMMREEGNTQEYKIEIINAALSVKRVELSLEADREFQRVWRSRGTYLLPYTRTDVLPQVITPGVYSHTLSNVNLFKVPHRLTILFMDQQQQMGGRYEQDPLSFENYSLKQISFELAERKVATYKMSFVDGKVNFLEPYIALKESFSDLSDEHLSNKELTMLGYQRLALPDLIVDPETFRNSLFVIRIDLRIMASMVLGYANVPLTIRFDFDKPTPANGLGCLVIAEHKAAVQIKPDGTTDCYLLAK